MQAVFLPFTVSTFPSNKNYRFVVLYFIFSLFTLASITESILYTKEEPVSVTGSFFMQAVSKH